MADPGSQPYEPPQVDIEQRKAAFNAFVKFCGSAGMHVLLIAGYLTLVFAIGMNWLIALALMALAGIGGGLLMRLGSGWYLGLLAQALIVLFARICVLLFMAVS